MKWWAWIAAAAALLLLSRRGTVTAITEAIGAVESSGRYDAVGPATRGGHRAYGKYQVMDFNIGPWSLAVLGRQLTPAAFLAAPAAQDAIARAKVAEYFAAFPTVEDVASLWFAGVPLARAGAAADVTGTTVPEYVQRVREHFDRLRGGTA